ncbi:MAG: flagellar biosynthesis protein FlhB [Candidatus Gastranaerophilaceae bacterium]|jgi:flagellar biosynthetic protein FlhB
MSEERTEKATPKRRSKSREEGQIPKSQDLNSALTLSIGMFLLFSFAPGILNKLKTLFSITFSNLLPSFINPSNFVGLMTPFVITTTEILLPFLLILTICSILIVRLQIGHLITFETLKPKFDKFTPQGFISGINNSLNFFKPDKIVELLKSFMKMIVIGGFCWSVINSRKQELLTLLGADLNLSFSTIASILAQIATQVCIAMIIIGIIDRIYQHFKFEKSLKMTKQEVKDERKNAEGDPAIKNKIKGTQMKFAQQMMMSKIPQADVIVTNPTHYAVALKYDNSEAPAPKVVAKGVDFLAFKIREIAENNNIPIVENPPLARTLYKIVPLDGVIPSELFVAVAEVLAYVYKKNQKRGGNTT